MNTAQLDQNQDYLKIKDNKELSHIPGSYGLPVLGKTVGFVDKPFAVMDDIYKTYGPVSKLSLTFQRVVLLLGPEYIKQVALDRDQSYSSRMGYDGPMGDFFYGGLLLRDFAEHKYHRRIMQTAFKTDSMRGYIDTMQPIIEQRLPTWGKIDDFHFYPNIKTLLLDVGAAVFMGMDMEGEETRQMNEAFLDMMAGSLAFIRKDYPGLLYHKGMNGRRWLENYFGELVPARRESTGTDMASFFSRERTEDGEYFPADIVAYHLAFLMLAAHDTTTSALTMACHLLARHPEWQEKIREEAWALNKPHAEYDDLDANLPATDRVFKETLRLHPPVPNLLRRTVKDIEIDGFLIPAHTQIQVSPLYVHRMEEWWSNPHAFDPDRFAPGREEHKRHPFLWAPFGGGIHKCIGMHFADMLFKSVLPELLKQYHLRFPDGYQYPTKIQDFPFAKPKDNLPLILEPVTRR